MRNVSGQVEGEDVLMEGSEGTHGALTCALKFDILALSLLYFSISLHL